MTTLVVVAGLAMSASAFAAGVDDDGAKEHEQGFDQPLNARGAGSAMSTTVITANNGQHEYKYENKGGIVRVTRDGVQLKKDQYREKDGKLEFLDANGNVEYSLDMPKVDQNMRGLGRLQELRMQAQPGRGRARVMNLGPDGLSRLTQDNPPVMMGVSISTSENDTGKGIFVQDVNEDGPAEKAGIKAGDRILFVEGKEVNSLTDLRTLLKTYKPGQKVDVKVDRDGQERVFTVELVKFEEAAVSAWNLDEDGNVELNQRLQELMGQQMGQNPGWLGLEGFTFTDRDVKDMKMVEEELEAATEALKEAEGKALEAQQQAKLAERLARALEGVKRVREIQSGTNSRARGVIIQPPAVPQRHGWNQNNGDEDLQGLQDELKEMREQLKQMRKELQERKP